MRKIIEDFVSDKIRLSSSTFESKSCMIINITHIELMLHACVSHVHECIVGVLHTLLEGLKIYLVKDLRDQGQERA